MLMVLLVPPGLPVLPLPCPLPVPLGVTVNIALGLEVPELLNAVVDEVLSLVDPLFLGLEVAIVPSDVLEVSITARYLLAIISAVELGKAHTCSDLWAFQTSYSP